MPAMGEKNQQSLPEDGEMKIPVFTVLKNGAILKNIFIVNKSPESQSLASSGHDYDEDDDVLIVGRHPDCNILLTHPSISRFHLQIQSNSSSQKLSVLDLSSVHGTWVSERKIEPGVSVELKEGDTLRIGASSRVYRLHWIPLSRAYDLENPLVSELDVAMETEKGKEDDAVPEEEEKEIVQNVNFCSVDNEEVQSVDSILESINCLFPDENLEFIVKKEIPSAPPMPEDFISFYCGEEGNCPSKDDHREGKTTRFSSGPFGTETSNLHTNSESEHTVCDIELQVLSPPHVESVLGCDNLNTAFQGPEKISNFSANLGSFFHAEEEFKAYPEAKIPGDTNILSTLREYLRESICLPVVEAVQGTKMQQLQGVQQNAPSDAFTSQLPPIKQKALFEKHWSKMLTNPDPASFDRTGAAAAGEMPKETGFGCTLRDDARGRDMLTTEAENLITEKTSLLVEEATLGTEFEQVEISEELALDSLSDGEKQNKCSQEHKSKFQPYENDSPCHEQGHSMDDIVQDIGNKCSSVLISLQAESLNTPLPEELTLEITNKKKNQTQRSLMAVAGCSQKKFSTFGNIWSRRGKAPASAPQIRAGKSRVKSTAHVDTEVDMSNQRDINDKTISRDPLSIVDREEEEEIFTPDKENFSPNTLQLQFLKKKSKLEDIKHSKLRQRSHNSKGYFSLNIYPDEIPISEKENQTLKVDQEQKSERRPFGRHVKFEQDILEMSNHKDITNKTIPKDPLSDLDEEEEEIYTPDKENFSPNTLQLLLKKKGKLEEIKHCKSRRRAHNSKDYFSPNIYTDEIPISEKENQTAKVAPAQKSYRRPFGSHIKLEPAIVDKSNQKNIKNETISKNLLSDLDEEEEEIYTSDKENFSPNTLELRLPKRKGMLEEIKHSKSRISHSSNANFSSNIYPAESNIPISEKENHTPKVAEEQKSNRRPFGSHIELEQEQDITLENRQETLPFQSLLMISRGKCRAETSRSVSAAKNVNPNCAEISDKCTNPSFYSQHISERSWNMVVDTASLLNKESRKALLLLQGLKGTRLIIPRMVIKELDSMKRQFSFFRRKSEASLALEWIEECMVKTKWWIHVQSSMEEGRLIAPTPPATPQTQFSEENWTMLLSSHKSPMEIVSPTAEDHILDCALLYRRKQNDGQLVLLSDDVTLKIKSMAEGLLCETVQEFRESLVNPFSERFLWADSSPRGLTWSCQDDVVLKEKYCRSPSRKSSKGGVAKGLKLILLHNSRYGHVSSAY